MCSGSKGVSFLCHGGLLQTAGVRQPSRDGNLRQDALAPSLGISRSHLPNESHGAAGPGWKWPSPWTLGRAQSQLTLLPSDMLNTQFSEHSWRFWFTKAFKGPRKGHVHDALQMILTCSHIASVNLRIGG